MQWATRSENLLAEYANSVPDSISIGRMIKRTRGPLQCATTGELVFGPKSRLTRQCHADGHSDEQARLSVGKCRILNTK